MRVLCSSSGGYDLVKRVRTALRISSWITALAVVVLFGVTRASAQSPDVNTLIELAGNADDDLERLAYLRLLQQVETLDPQLKADLDKLVASIERWVGEPRLNYFGSGMRDFDYDVAQESLLYPIVTFYRARMMVWVAYELGYGTDWFEQADELFRVTQQAFPENRIAGMYLGEPIVVPKLRPIPPAAPKWAVLQRECLERLADVVEWWIDHRQQPSGEYGGGLEDDVEMWRRWVPVLIAFDDPKISAAQERLSERVMGAPNMALGYPEIVHDVQHNAEYTSDSITPMMLLDPDNETWNQRALRLAELMETLWTGRNERGYLQFKSVYFSATEVMAAPNRACDTNYHTRAIQPALIYWLRTADPRLGRLFLDWLDTWVEATARAERGKPAGVIPAAIHWPDGAIGGLGEDWIHTGCGDPRLYDWPSATQKKARTLLLAYHMTGDPKYLEPLRSMVANGYGLLVDQALAKYRFLTGNTEFDEFLSQHGEPYVQFRLGGDEKVLVKALRDNAKVLQTNYPGYTQEVRYTDRLFRFPTKFPRHSRSGRFVDPRVLYSMASGDPADIRYFPLNAVRWLTPPRDIAVLVTESSTERFRAQLFHFGQRLRPMAAELYLLKPGEYIVTGNGQHLGELTVTTPRTRLTFELPAGQLFTLQIEPAEAADE